MNLNEAKSILHKNGLMLVDKTLNESKNEPRYYTGLLYKDAYAGILSSVTGQITDGIGEGDNKTSKIFAYYFSDLVGEVHSDNENGELVLICPSYDMELLMKCIWRIASIEREDCGTEERNRTYEYLRNASWKDICSLQAAIKKIIANDYETQPMSDEEKQKKIDKRDQYRKQAEEKKKAEEEAKAKAEEEQKQKELAAKNEKIKIIETYPTDEKDKKRAEDALRRSSGLFANYYKSLAQQLNKITDTAKWKRRIAAFYQAAKGRTWRDDEATCEYYTNRMINRF